jgi:hypothetical protein
MNIVYELVHVKRDKSEQLITTVTDLNDINFYTESSRYHGTWLNETRKMLRYGMGELQVRKIVKHPTIAGHAFTVFNGQDVCLLNIKHDANLHWIAISEDCITGYDLTKRIVLWKVTNFAKLTLHTNKDIAYGCMQLYDQLLDMYGLKGAM